MIYGNGGYTFTYRRQRGYATTYHVHRAIERLDRVLDNIYNAGMRAPII